MYDKNIKYKIIILTRILSGMFYIHLTTINWYNLINISFPMVMYFLSY